MVKTSQRVNRSTMVLGLGSWEVVLVGLALLTLFGPEHAPQLIRKAGQLQARTRRAFQQLEEAVEQEQAEDKLTFPDPDELPSSPEEPDEDGDPDDRDQR